MTSGTNSVRIQIHTRVDSVFSCIFHFIHISFQLQSKMRRLHVIQYCKKCHRSWVAVLFFKESLSLLMQSAVVEHTYYCQLIRKKDLISRNWLFSISAHCSKELLRIYCFTSHAIGFNLFCYCYFFHRFSRMMHRVQCDCIHQYPPRKRPNQRIYSIPQSPH